MKLQSKKEAHKYSLTITEVISERESQILISGIKKIIEENFREIELIFNDDLPSEESCYLINELKKQMKERNNYLITKYALNEMKELFEAKSTLYDHLLKNKELKLTLSSLDLKASGAIKNENIKLQKTIRKYDQILGIFKADMRNSLESSVLEPMLSLQNDLKLILIEFCES